MHSYILLLLGSQYMHDHLVSTCVHVYWNDNVIQTYECVFYMHVMKSACIIWKLTCQSSVISLKIYSFILLETKFQLTSIYSVIPEL